MAYKYIAQKIKKEYPALINGKDYDIVADGDNANIKILWRHASPPPSLADIDAAYTDASIAVEEENANLSAQFDLSRKDKVLVKWIANLHGLSIPAARAQLKALWDATP